jgi:hypothetical protein
MKLLSVKSTALNLAGRLDSWYFLSPANQATQTLLHARARGVRFRMLGGSGGIAHSVKLPPRYKRALAAPGEPGLPYLRPYDVFNYLPEAADTVSATRTENLSTYQLKSGLILQTRSGRNLGPAVASDAYLASFVLSDDMIRIEISDEIMRHYVLAYLKSRSGQQLIRRDKTGSVIDHLSDSHLARQEIPILEEPVFSKVATTMGQAVRLREEARLRLASLIDHYQGLLPALHRKRPMRLGWTIRSVQLTGRVDAAHYDPLVRSIRQQLLDMGGVTVGDVATVTQPKRYKRLYTTPEFGRPIISGTQLLQSKPINPQHILEKSFDNVADYELKSGSIAYPSDGRAEEGLGTPAYVTTDRDGWLASNMVGRIIPNQGTDVGWLYLALKTPHAQRQFKAQASGSVVDHTYPADMECVVLPPPLGVDGKQAVIAWEKFSEAQALEDSAASMMDTALSGPAAAR